MLLALGRGAINLPFHPSLQLPVSESESSRTGAGNGEGHDTGAGEDGRARRPLP